MFGLMPAPASAPLWNVVQVAGSIRTKRGSLLHCNVEYSSIEKSAACCLNVCALFEVVVWKIVVLGVFLMTEL